MLFSLIVYLASKMTKIALLISAVTLCFVQGYSNRDQHTYIWFVSNHNVVKVVIQMTT